MPLHITLVSPDSQTPSYLLTCARTGHRTLIDPIDAAAAETVLQHQPLDLILLTTLTPKTLKAAHALHMGTKAPILAASNDAEQAHKLPVARTLTDGDIVALGPLAQTLSLPAPEAPTTSSAHAAHTPQAETPPHIMAYAIGSLGLVFTGPLFAEKPRRPLPAELVGVPGDWLVFGGHAPQADADSAPTLASLRK